MICSCGDCIYRLPNAFVPIFSIPYTHLIRSLNFLTSFVNSALYALLHCVRIAIINVFNSCIVYCVCSVN